MRIRISVLKVLLLLAMIFITSCKDEESTSPNSSDVFGLLGSSDYFTLQELVDDWDNGNLNGVIFIKKENNKIYEIITHNGIVDSSNYEGVEYSAKAGLFNSSYKGLDVNDFVINAYDMERYSKGKYGNTKPYEFSTRFGLGINKIEIDSNNLFNKLLDSVQFGQAVQISNFTRGDTMSKSLGYTLNWSGSPSATKAFVSISHTNSFDPTIYPDTVTSGLSWYQNNIGSVDLTPYLYNITFPGTYDLTVTLFEPHYINLSNSKQILVIGESTHRVSFKLTN